MPANDLEALRVHGGAIAALADVTVMTDADIISVPTGMLAQASDACRHKFDRIFMEILVERLSMANLRLSGV